jgi:hypothetical protein
MSGQNFTVSFTWLKPVVGYEWEDCEAIGFGEDSLKIPDSPFLVEKDYSQEMTVYHPFDDPAMFAKFADLKGDNEAFAQWASAYGMLTGGESLTVSRLLALPKNTLNPKSPIHSAGVTVNRPDGRYLAQLSESAEFWHREHRAFALATMFWELAHNGDVENLSKLVIWSGQDVVTILGAKRDNIDSRGVKNIFSREVLFHVRENMNAGLATLCRYPEVIKPALFYVQMCVTRKLKEYPLNIFLQMDEHGGLKNHLQPSSLLSAMWYQLLLALKGDIRLRRCDLCGKWEDMSKHRANWQRHKTCASNKRVEEFRKKHA